MGSITEPTTFGKYVLNGVTTKEEMDKIMDVIWEANYDPYDPFVQLFFPILGFTAADREAAVAESKERFWKEKQKSPDKHWFYIEDTDVQKIVACVQWEIAQQNPFPDGPPKLKAPWWPEGEHREFCELILNQTYAARANWMGRRHIGKFTDTFPQMLSTHHVPLGATTGPKISDSELEPILQNICCCYPLTYLPTQH